MIANMLKEVGIIQPTDCQCLPELTRHMLQFLIEDKIQNDKSKMASLKEHIEKYPTMAKRMDSLLQSNQQYQKGLVTARDLLGDYAGSTSVVEEFKDSVEAHKYLLDMIKAIPYCPGGAGRRKGING